MTIIFTAEAERRLREIFNYYNLNASRKVALKIVNEIITETEILETKPYIGIRESLLVNRRFNYFFIIIKNYKVIYRLSEELIIVSTVFDTRQNPRKISRRVK
jgi:plasmid stabilization system protein ParE